MGSNPNETHISFGSIFVTGIRLHLVTMDSIPTGVPECRRGHRARIAPQDTAQGDPGVPRTEDRGLCTRQASQEKALSLDRYHRRGLLPRAARL